MIDTAKDLIKKGNELGDEELITMGHQMLAKYQPPTEEEEKKTEEFEYVCTNCEHEFSSPKKRKACPNCRKHKLKPKEEKPQQLQKKNNDRLTINDFTTDIIKENNTRKRINPDTGEEEGTYARTEQIVPGTIKNTWQDNGVDFKDDDFDKIVRSSVSERTRKPAKKIKKVCESCETTFYVSPTHSRQYLCNKCITGRTRRR